MWCLFQGGAFDGRVVDVADDDIDRRTATWRVAPTDGEQRRRAPRCVYADTGRTALVDGNVVRVFGHWADWQSRDTIARW